MAHDAHTGPVKSTKKPWRERLNSNRPNDERDWNLSDQDTYMEFIHDLDAEIRAVQDKLMNWLHYKNEIQFRYGTIRSRVQ